ncbi:MAG: hypothetical protein JO126_03455 [Alphaproteobacteria bacterium]|nr:hypothetical protein [Alphaproteobacteria bacterium]MBV8548494.1 hypothetical protein [Alphaproteobacteria bacterium]
MVQQVLKVYEQTSLQYGAAETLTAEHPHRPEPHKQPSCRMYHDPDEGLDVPEYPPQKWAHLPMAEQIAEAIVDCMNKTGQCWIIDIRAMGFSLNDIARYWPDACAMAERKRPRQIAF